MQSIGVALICRNSEQTIASCIESFIGSVDQCVVVKAGVSTDKTPEILDGLKAKYPNLELYDFDWVDDFSAARNFSFSKLKTDWLLWVDSDDNLYNAEKLKSLAENAPPEVGAIWFPYHYSIDEFGNPTTVYERERLLRAKYGWVWRSRLHETVSPITQCKYVRTDEVIVRHEHTTGDSRKGRNFRILNLMLKDDPSDKRVWMYLGHQHFACQEWAKATEWYLKFGRDLGALPLERYQALCYCSKAMRSMRENQAVEVALLALELYPQYKDAYLELAECYLMLGDYDKSIHFAKMADVKEPMITEPPALIFINPQAYTFNKYVLMAECYLKKKEFKTAHDYMLMAYQVRPVPEIQRDIQLIDNEIRKERVIDGIRTLSVELLDTKEVARLPSLLAAIPYWYRETPEYDQIKAGVQHHTKEIVDKPEILEDGKNVTVNIGNSLTPEKVLAELDKKFDKVTVIAPMPIPESKQVVSYCQKDIEALLISNPGRRIINLQCEPTRIIAEYDHKEMDKGIAVRFFVGQGLEYWSPKTIKEVGCGGSETSAAWLARSLAQKGNQPIIYAMDDQVWDGVVYRPHTAFNPDATHSHLFISSRVPDVFDNNLPALQKWLWMHDICCWDRLTPDRAERINCIVTLSKWHCEHIKRVYPWLKDAEVIDLDEQPKTYDDLWTTGTYFAEEKASHLPKIAILGDAIDTSRFANLTAERVPYRFVWCSSPDRGLEELLKMWPLIKQAMPSATLKIFYGWDYFNSSLHVPEQRMFKERIRELIKQDGVQWCGRVGQDMLPNELAQADAIIYPPHNFRETYGIAFLEAQAAGVMCFYRENGALGETIGDRGIPIKMDATPEQIVKLVASTLQDKSLCVNVRERARKYGLMRDWAKQADKLLTLYRRLEDGS